MSAAEFAATLEAALARLRRRVGLRVWLGLAPALAAVVLARTVWRLLRLSSGFGLSDLVGVAVSAVGVLGGLAALLLWGPGLSQALARLTKLRGVTPRRWFVSPSHGLVVLLDDALVGERLPLMAFDSSAQEHLESASYLEHIQHRGQRLAREVAGHLDAELADAHHHRRLLHRRLVGNHLDSRQPHFARTLRSLPRPHRRRHPAT